MRLAYRFAAIVVAVAYLAMLVTLTRQQNGVPPHEDVTLPGDIPATFYMPGTANQPGPEDPFYQLFPSPPEKRPPGVLLIHGFTSDRTNTSSLARRIAQNGYGVLAIDVRGHGENRNPFNRELLRDDVAAGVAYLRQSTQIDPSRIVVIGHSMGAGAALDYANRNANLTASVMISGGFRLDGPERPRNALFIYAQNDLPFIPELSRMIATHITGDDHIEIGKRYGDFANGTALELIQVPGVNHVSILWSAETAQQIIKWLDSACGMQRPGDLNLRDARLNTILVVLVLFLLLMFPLGRIAGGLANVQERIPDIAGVPGAVAALVIAMVAAMPLISLVSPGSFIPLVVGNPAISWIAVAGGMLIVFTAVRLPDELRKLTAGWRQSLLVGAIAFGAIYVMSDYDVTLHRATLTPERLLVMLGSAVLVLPFFTAFEVLLRRGSMGTSTALSSAGFALVYFVMMIGLSLGVLPFGIAPPAILILFVMMQLFAVGVASTSGDLLLIAIVESLWYARLFAMVMPITFKL